MKLFFKAKDGGLESTVTGYWLIEWKRFFSIALLRFDGDSREAYHNHAFNAISWLLWGELWEHVLGPFRMSQVTYKPSWRPIWTPKRRMHKVSSDGRSWVLTFRGPWRDRWNEWLPQEQRSQTLTDGRAVVS